MNFCRYENKRKHKLVLIEISKNDSDRVVDLLIYKNHYAFIEKLKVILGDHHKNFIWRRFLNSYTSENMLMIHKTKCENYDITTFRTSSDSHPHWKNHLLKNPLYFRIYADFEAHKEIEKYNIGTKRNNIFKQNPILNSYHIDSELEDFSQSSYYKSRLGYNKVNWFVVEATRLENKMNFYFKNTKKDIVRTRRR